MSRLIDFYRGDRPDTEGRSLSAILAWNDADLEDVHDFIQWLFPLPEPSSYNPDAPLLTPSDIAIFQADPELRARLQLAFERFLTFLGLARDDAGQVIDGPNLAARAPEVWDRFNHNWLRVTRVLRSTTLLGLGDESRALFAWLVDARSRGRFPISESSFRYWSEAVNS